MATAYPETIGQTAQIIRAAAGGGSLQIIGNGSRYPADPGTPGLSVAGLSGIRIYEPNDWTVTVGAGTPLAQINKITSTNGQRLAFEVPTDRRKDDPDPKATIGGAIATNAGASPGRRLRDSVLGMRFINGNGEIIEAGSRAIKNVAGIDLARGLVGSWGNLALICEVTLRLVPVLPRQQTIAATVPTFVAALAPADASHADRTIEFGAIERPSSSARRSRDRLNDRIKQAFDPKGVFSSKPFLFRTAS
ncbi:MAG: FAD-binding oxidoreductase [Alphaproteobacteria bacterium]|nr:FAD-binding oxidoreductase [Alphaproteobacteria bacterium]